MKETENLTPQEVRDGFDPNWTPLEMGIRACLEDWKQAAAQLEPRVDWDDFFQVCFVALVDVYSVVLCIAQEEYYPLAHLPWFKDVLEAALLKVMRIPFYIELTTMEGGRDIVYWLELQQNQLKKLKRLHLNACSEIFTYPRTRSAPPA